MRNPFRKQINMVVGYLPSAESIIVQLCQEHRSIDNQIKRLVNNTPRENPPQQAIKDFADYRRQQGELQDQATHLFQQFTHLLN